ncbi:MAG: hypothetical protein M3R15_20645 [Acidobacteriota bacterium]|nr:hypothetical protein [Acidobacteriota bacterium]
MGTASQRIKRHGRRFTWVAGGDYLLTQPLTSSIFRHPHLLQSANGLAVSFE